MGLVLRLERKGNCISFIDGQNLELVEEEGGRREEEGQEVNEFTQGTAFPYMSPGYDRKYQCLYLFICIFFLPVPLKL